MSEKMEGQDPSKKLSLDNINVVIGDITERRDTSPKRVMHGEVAYSEEVDFNLDIDGEQYTATLHRSDYQDEVPTGYMVDMQPTRLVLKDSMGNQVGLSQKDKTALMIKLNHVLTEEK